MMVLVFEKVWYDSEVKLMIYAGGFMEAFQNYENECNEKKRNDSLLYIFQNNPSVRDTTR
jgi:hypothetical protein